MATTTGSHGVASFTAPINGTSPIDANSVRNNDNALRSAYVNHDSDTGIHVQSSDLALRPVASIPGRKWITVDGGVQRLWYDTGSTWIEVSAAGLSTAQTIALTGDVTGTVSTTLATGASIATTLADNTVTSAKIVDGTIVNADISASAAIADTKLATISTAGKVSNSATTATNANTASTIVARDASGNFSAGTIVAALTGNASTATALSSNRTFALTGDVTGTVSTTLASGASIATTLADNTVTSAKIVNGAIVNDDINASAGIVDTKLATIATAGKVSNSATTATSSNTNNAIVARDGSGNFSAGTVTAALTGNASTATALSSNRTFALTGDVTGSVSSNLSSGASISTAIAAGAIVNADISASAAIDYSKLASLTSGNILVGSASNVPTARSMSGDVTISNTGVATASAAFSRIIKTHMVGSIDLTGGGTVTVFTASVPSIAAGDIVEVSLQSTRFNNSGSSRIWTYTMSLGSASVSIVTANLSTNANKRPDTLMVRFGCVSSAQAFVYGSGQLGDAVAEGTTTTSQNAIVYEDDAVDITGTNTLTVSIDINTPGSNQALEAVMANVRLIKAV